MVFDARFKTSKIHQSLCNSLINETKVARIDFNSITDYFVLAIYLAKNLQFPRTVLKSTISDFESITETLRKQIPFSIFSQIIHTNTRNKVSLLRSFLKG